MAEAALSGGGAVTVRELRVFGLFAAIFVYACFGAPTPEAAGFAEIIVAVLLAAAAGAGGARQAFTFEAAAGTWQGAGRMLLAYGLAVPLFTGLALGNSLTAILRDMIPFLFLLLPLFLSPLVEGRERDVRALTGVIVVLGLVFSARVLLPYALEQPVVLDPLRFANAPTVLFAALLLTGLCVVFLYRGDLFKSAVCFALMLVPLAAMALITQRASIGVFCLSALALLAAGIARRPKRVLLPLLLAALMAAVYWPVLAGVAQGLIAKQEAVGLNMRWQEAVAVIDALDGSALAVLLGKGWGASVASPAVGGASVNFTHSLITTYWLKAGLLGVCFVLFYLFHFGLMILRIAFAQPVIAFALAGPFVIDIVLYASFKSLDFGLLLLLIPLWHSIEMKKLDRAF